MTISNLKEEVLRLASRLTREGQIDQLERCVGIVKELNSLNDELQEVAQSTTSIDPTAQIPEETDFERTTPTKAPDEFDENGGIASIKPTTRAQELTEAVPTESSSDDVVEILRNLSPVQRYSEDDWTDFIDKDWVSTAEVERFAGEGKDLVYKWKNDNEVVWRLKPFSKRQIFQFCPKSIALRLVGMPDPRLF